VGIQIPVGSLPTHIRSRNPCISDGLFAEFAPRDTIGQTTPYRFNTHTKLFCHASQSLAFSSHIGLPYCSSPDFRDGRSANGFATPGAFLLGSLHASEDTFTYHGFFKHCKDRQHPEHHSTSRGGGIESLLMEEQIDLALP
jgi:hypothetical protein